MKKITTATGRRTGKVQEQRLTIGLDAGDRSSFYCVVNGTGEVILQAKVATRPEALKEAFGRMPRSRIALERGTHSPWMSRLLSELDRLCAAPRSVCRPARVILWSKFRPTR